MRGYEQEPVKAWAIWHSAENGFPALIAAVMAHSQRRALAKIWSTVWYLENHSRIGKIWATSIRPGVAVGRPA